MKTLLSKRESNSLLKTLKSRFKKYPERHVEISWENLSEHLLSNPEKLAVIHRMEETGGEPDVVDFDPKTNTYTFADCAEESPRGRRSLCYDKEALIAQPRSKPKNNVEDFAEEIGVQILTVQQYRELQEICKFDTKTSSWLKTPGNVRKLGGAIFGDYRYDQVFIYHNSAQAFYVSRGFRGLVRV